MYVFSNETNKVLKEGYLIGQDNAIVPSPIYFQVILFVWPLSGSVLCYSMHLLDISWKRYH